MDFARDVWPLLQEHCLECHGPKQQKNNFRLDRRRDAMRGGTGTVIGPGNSAGSRLYLRLIGDRYGPRMPPEEALPSGQIATIKAWIDQGAEWPDALAGDVPPPVADPRATRLMASLRRDGAGWRRVLRADLAAATLQGPGGSTPLMYAALYQDAASVRLLLERGADANVRNEAGATALMWAAGEIDKVRLLVAAGADVKARSDDGRTALLIAAGRPHSLEIVRLLLDRGASPVVKGSDSPLVSAAGFGDLALMRLLIEHGADPGSAGPAALAAAVRSKCVPCLDLLAGQARKTNLAKAALLLVPAAGDGHDLPALLERGADPSTTDRDGRSLLMLVASSDVFPLEAARALLARGADVNARSPGGDTALGLARLRGQTPMVDLLLEAGAKDAPRSPPGPSAPQPASSPRQALERLIPLLQRSDEAFLRKSGCVSCHHNTLTAHTMATARKNGLALDERLARKQVQAMGGHLEALRERALQDKRIGGGFGTVSHILAGLDAGGYAPDLATDAMARYLKSYQLPDGRWPKFGHRPPSSTSAITVTANGLRSLLAYAPPGQRRQYQGAARRAAAWLLRARPASTEERAYQLLGLTWAGKRRNPAVRAGGRALLAEQRPDGGWAQIPSLGSDAYATGQALFALQESGVLAAGDASYQRGVQFLLQTQFADGSWYVKSRAIPFQPFFESGFPHGQDQWISIAATNWAAMALASAADRSGKPRVAAQ